MKIAHLIPASFEYFEDIKGEAFALVEAQSNLGMEVEAFTLQFGRVSVAALDGAGEGTQRFISRKFSGKMSFSDVLFGLSGFQVVHVHCPFFGGIQKILKWKANNPNIVLVVSFYHLIPVTDLFSYLVRWYNSLVLPKLFRVADLVTTISPEEVPKSLKRMAKLYIPMDYGPEFAGGDFSEVNGYRLKPEERLGVKLMLIYQEIFDELTNKKT
ncbi:MAG: glycosyltransferase [Candidatus Magasanikbacteria bacterium]|nr:glycosyltransferase [Candidatus Magasanikbacteria bacterium]